MNRRVCSVLFPCLARKRGFSRRLLGQGRLAEQERSFRRVCSPRRICSGGQTQLDAKCPAQSPVGMVVNEETCFVGGPVEAVKAKTKAYVCCCPVTTSEKSF